MFNESRPALIRLTTAAAVGTVVSYQDVGHVDEHRDDDDEMDSVLDVVEARLDPTRGLLFVNFGSTTFGSSALTCYDVWKRDGAESSTTATPPSATTEAAETAVAAADDV